MRGALILLAGCDSLFGIRHFDLPIDASDAPTAFVTGTVHERHVVNGSTGAPQISDVIPASATGTAMLDDGSISPISYADGMFTFPVAAAGQHYALRLSAGDVLYQLEHSASSEERRVGKECR